jgi:hypothetical protein
LLAPPFQVALLESAIDERLDAPSGRIEQDRYRQRGDYDGELRFPSGKDAEGRLEHYDARDVRQSTSVAVSVQ